MSLHTTQENTQSLETVVSSGEANTNYNADWRELSADLVLSILSYLRIDQSHVNELKSNAYKLLYGYFADDPNREIHFLYCHFSIRRGAASSTTGNENRAMSAQDSFSCIFKNAAHLSVRLDDIDHCPAIFSALRENWKLVRLENESQQIKSSSLLIQSLDDCKPKLQHFSSHVATEEDLDHLSMFDQLQSITIRMLSLSGEHAEMHAELQSIELQRQAEALATNQQNENGEDEVMQVSSLPPLFDLAGVLKDHWHHLSYLELNTLGTKVAEQMVDLRLVLGGHLRSLFSHSSIQTLVLSNQMIQATDLDSFCENEAMVSLNLSGCTFADRKTLQNLAANPFLKNLKLIGCSLTSALASCLFESNTYAHGSFASLEKLSLAVNPKITSRLTKLISATSKNEFVLPKLKHLNMSGCKLGSLGAIGVANLVSKSIKLLYMKSCGITDEGLVGMLKACPELMCISLCDNKISLQGLSKEYMGLCPNMRRIKLQRNCISSDGALWLAKQFDSAPRLWSMEMDHNANLGDEGASHLLSCLALKRLSLNECNITDRFILDNFQDLEQMTQSRLMEVCLIGNRITDTGARVLLNSPLQRVLLSRNKQLTEDSVYHLLSSRTLQKIWMEGLPLVSAQVKQKVMDHVKQFMADQIYSIRL